jgi:ABC-type Co2+ transport system permease subunit
MPKRAKKIGAILGAVLLPVSRAYAGEGKELLLFVWLAGVLLVDIGYAAGLYLLARLTNAQRFKPFLLGWGVLTVLAVLLQWAVLNSGGISTSFRDAFGGGFGVFLWGPLLILSIWAIGYKAGQEKI